jgi:uridine kinase
MRYDALVARLQRLPGEVRLVAIDGCGGAGKSTFASRLSKTCGGCPVIHTDDFASWDVPLDWWPRMLREVVEPLSAGRAAVYRRYDWDLKELAEQITVSPSPIVVVEGVSASRAEWADKLAFAVWVDAPRDVRLQRGLDRDGIGAASLWAGWMADEDSYIARDQPIERADLVVAGASDLRHDAETEFVIAALG